MVVELELVVQSELAALGLLGKATLAEADSDRVPSVLVAVAAELERSVRMAQQIKPVMVALVSLRISTEPQHSEVVAVAAVLSAAQSELAELVAVLTDRLAQAALELQILAAVAVVAV